MNGRKPRNYGGRPREYVGRTTRQVSLDGESAVIAGEMENFSAFVRQCLSYRSENEPRSTKEMLGVVQNRLIKTMDNLPVETPLNRVTEYETKIREITQLILWLKTV